jgi:cytochrome c oxidase cbb3-type subunit 3
MSDKVTQKERDAFTGTETTGHVWDGIKELNTPLPKWWLYVLYASIVWAIGYWILYPAWPGIASYTSGLLGYSTRANFHRDAAAAADAQRVWLDRIHAASVEQISSDPELVEFAQNGGRAVFAENCAPCHGAGGQGAPGFPVLADDSWLWGGDLASIEQTIRHGIRATDADTRVSDMPRFGADQMLDATQISDVADYVMSLSGTAIDPAVQERGATVFAENCAACHGDQGEGKMELGAPALNDSLWLYGGDRASIVAQNDRPKQGVMPAWQGRISDDWIKMVTIYVHNLGGGQ